MQQKKRARFTVVARVLLFMVACAVMLAVAAPLLRGELAIGAATAAGAFALTWLFLRWDGLRLHDAGAAVDGGTPLRFALGFATGLVLVTLWALLCAAAGYVRWELSSPTAASLLPALATYLVLSSREELAFRGYPLRRLNDVFGLTVAQTFVAILFALEHVAGGATWVNAVLGAGTGSLLFGIAAIGSRGLALPIGLHAAWNFGHWSLGLKGGSSLWRPIVASGDAVPAEIVGMTIYVIVIGSAALLFRSWTKHSPAAASS